MPFIPQQMSLLGPRVLPLGILLQGPAATVAGIISLPLMLHLLAVEELLEPREKGGRDSQARFSGVFDITCSSPGKDQRLCNVCKRNSCWYRR